MASGGVEVDVKEEIAEGGLEGGIWWEKCNNTSLLAFGSVCECGVSEKIKNVLGKALLMVSGYLKRSSTGVEFRP